MARVKRGVHKRQRHNKVLKQAKGYYGARSRCYRVAIESLLRSGAYAYRDRRQKKREFRALWIVRVNAAARLHGLSYSRLMYALKQLDVLIDRKNLAELAVYEEAAFAALVEKAKALLAAEDAVAA